MIVSEISQKDKYHMISLTCWILKNDTNEFIYKWYKFICRKQSYSHQKEKERGREKLGVGDKQIHTTVYKIDKQQRPTV